MTPTELIFRVAHSPDPERLPLGPCLNLPPQDALLIGRGPEADLRLDDRSVSRAHARLAWRGDAWVVENVSAHNGLFLDQQPIAPGEQRLLPREAHLQVGAVLLEIHALEGTLPFHDPLPTPPAPPRAQDLPFLDLLRDGDSCAVRCKGRFVAMKPSCALVLFALASSPGQVVHDWDLQEITGQSYDLPQAISGIRRAFRHLLDEGWVTPQEICDHILAVSTGPHTSDLSDLDASQLLRRFVMARRGHGYILMLPERAVRADEAG